MLENTAAEENAGGDNDALLQEIAESSAKETRTPIFKPTRTNSEGKQRDLQVGARDSRWLLSFRHFKLKCVSMLIHFKY